MMVNIKKLNKKMMKIKKMQGPNESCPVCKNRLDDTVTVPPYWIGDKIDDYNKFVVLNFKGLGKNDLKILEQLKFKFLNKIIDSSIRKLKKEKDTIKNEKDKNNN